MRLTHVRVQNYRSVRDTGWFDIEQAKTILVGPNEAGKTAVLEALQRINPPDGVRGFVPLPDYPRKLYNADIQLGRWQQPRWTLGHVITDIPHIRLRVSKEPAILQDGDGRGLHERRQLSHRAHKTISRCRELASARQRRRLSARLHTLQLIQHSGAALAVPRPHLWKVFFGDL